MLTRGPMALAIELITTWRPEKQYYMNNALYIPQSLETIVFIYFYLYFIIGDNLL